MQMVNKSRKLLAVLLALSMLFSMLSVPVFAANEDEDTVVSENAVQKPDEPQEDEEIKDAEETESPEATSAPEETEAVEDPEEPQVTEEVPAEPEAPEVTEAPTEPEETEAPEESEEPQEDVDSDDEEEILVPLSNDVPCTDPWSVSDAEAWIRESINGAKFLAVIASVPTNGVAPTKVVGRVDADYTATLTIPGTEVSSGNMTIGVGMNNVGSLGVDGIKVHAMAIPTGVTEDSLRIVALSSILSVDYFNLSGSITANIKNNGGEAAETVTYSIRTQSTSDGGRQITGTPNSVEKARDAWQLMMANFNTTTQAADDSSFTIANGSWLQIGDKVLCFTGEGDLVLDNILNGNIQSTIRDAVKLNDITGSSRVAFCLKKGTKLAVSSSIATLNEDMMVEITGFSDVDLNDVLSSLQGATTTGDMIRTLVTGVMPTVLQAVNRQNIIVNIEFGEPAEVVEEDAKFKVEITSTLNDNTTTTVTGTVDKNYAAKLVLPNANVNAGNVTVKVSMTDVGSLGITGTRSHSMTLGTGVNTEGNLFDALNGLQANALASFEDATINATIISDGETKNVIYTLNGEEFSVENGKIITGTPDSPDAARAAWALMVNSRNFEVGTQDPDSKIVIANGSSLQIGKEVLKFEDSFGDDLVLDNIASMDVETITSAVKLETVEDSALTFTLKKGTMLAVSSSYAKLNKDVVVTVTGVDTSDLTVLSGIRAAIHNNEMGAKGIIIELIKLMDTAISLVNKQNIGVTIEFLCEHEYKNTAWNWNGYTSAEAVFTCTNCNDEQTVKATSITNDGGRPTRTYTATVTFNGQDYTDTKVQTISSGGSTGGGSTGGGSYTPPSKPSNPGEIEIEKPDIPLGEKPFLFADVTETVWYYEYVKKAFNWDLMEGVAVTRFAPHLDSTRAMIAQVLYRLAGKPGIEDYDVEIPDLKDTDWFHDAAIWAYATGVYTGFSDGTFQGERMITREQLAAVLHRFTSMNGYNVDDINDLSAYQDKDKVSDWAMDGAQWAVGTGLLRGRSNTMLVPEDGTTRAELAAVLVRFVEKYMPELAGPTIV